MRDSKSPPGFRREIRNIALLAAALCAGSTQAANFTTNFATDPGGAASGIAEIEDGVLKLTDLADLPPADPSKPLPQNGMYVLPDFNNGANIGSFTATFKAAVGGGSALGAQGFSFMLANDYPADGTTTFREGGGSSQGLVISFDTIDNLAGFNAEGNDPGDAPGIIVKFGGAKVAVKRFDGIQTYPANSTAVAWANVSVTLEADGTLDLTYNGTPIFQNVGIGYTPIAGAFGFGAGTAELTAAIRNNHWIDDVNITATPVTAGSFISSKSPAAQNARADSSIVIVAENLVSSTVELKFDGKAVNATVGPAVGTSRTISYRPPTLLASGSHHTVELTYDGKKFAFEFNVGNYVTIPATAKVGGINTSSSGFKTRVHQVVSPPPASVANAERQLSGAVGANIADLSAADSDGTFTIPTINWDDDQAGAGQFPSDDPIPGYPGTNPDGNAVTDNIVIESIAYLDLPAGLITLGVTSDDGFKLSVGGDPRDATAPVVASFNGVSTSVFSFVIQEAGFYGVRLLWYEAAGDAHCELYSFNLAGDRILVNDRATSGNIRAYSQRTGAAAPYISSAKPAPGETGVNPKLSMDVVITEESTTVNASTIVLKVKDVAIQPLSITKSGKQTTVSYRHPGTIPEGTYPVVMTFSDGSGNNVSSAWSFSTAPGACENVAGPAATGYWTFDDGLNATVGTAAAYIDSSIAGTAGYAINTSGVGGAADVPNINGKPARFLTIPRNENGEDFRKTGLRIQPGLAPSGGGRNANVWTMIMDVYWGEGHGFGTVFRTHDLNQNNDGDLFWRASDGSYGKGCCSLYDGIDPAHSHQRLAWGRVVFVADMTSTPKRFAKYVNGFKHREDPAGDGANIDGRYSLPSEIFMFNDGDDNEQSTVHVSAIQFREGALTDEEVAALGGPSADGIPVPKGNQSTGIASQWEFNGALQAKKGAAAQYIDDSISSHYSFGTTGQGNYADIPNINGQSAQFLAIPRNENGEDFRKTGLRIQPGLAPSGGGRNANVWTMVMDVYWGEGHGFGTVFRTHDLNQNNDGDLFWRASDGSYGKGCCSLYDGIDPAHSHQRLAWGRIVFVADMTSTPKRFAKYVNGFKHREDPAGDGANIDGRYSLPSEIFMFNDGDDNEQSTVLVNSIQFRPVAMTDAEVAALGGPSAAGIPEPETASPSIKGHWDFNGSLNGVVGGTISYIDPSIAGTAGYAFANTGGDVSAINGQTAQFLTIPRNDNGEDFRKTGIKVPTGLSASGGGRNANVWTMIMDVNWGEGHGFGTVFRTHDLNQNNDGDLFWRASDGSYGKGCCSLYDGIDPAHSHQRLAWGRIVFVADMTSTPKRFAKYVNGFKHREDPAGDGANIDGRYSLPAEIYMFNDGDDNEQSTVHINSLQIRDVALTDEEVAALGGPTAGGPPLTGAGAEACVPLDGTIQADPPTLTVSRNANGAVIISWQSPVVFTLESKNALSDPTWTAVSGVANNSITIQPGTTPGAKFYRLRK